LIEDWNIGVVNRHLGRDGITYERYVSIVREPRYTEPGKEGELLFYGYASEVQGGKWLRVVTTTDREVLITAHLDRSFRKPVERGEVR
jgi:hypothetical protein